MKNWLIALLSVFCAAWAAQLVADSDPGPVRKRFPVWDVRAPGDWTSPALFRGRRGVIASRSGRPRLFVSNPASEAYRVRVFYVLEGEPADVMVSGVRAARLEPGGKWRRAVFSAPFSAKGEKLEIAFGLTAGSRLHLRRIDYRNYFFRLGSFFSIKPPGGARAPAGAAWRLLIAALLIAAGAVGVYLRLETEGAPAALERTFLPAGLIGLAAILAQLIAGYSLHAHPAFAAAVFAGVSAAEAFPAGKRNWRLALGRLAAASVATALALAAAEVALVIWDPPMSRPRVRSYSKYSPEFGWVNRPGARGWHVDIGYHIRIDEFGHRGPDRSPEKPGGVFRILGLGDSFGFGWGVEDERTFLRVLESRLRAEGHRVEVINAGVPAWHSVQSLAYLLGRGVRFKPDLVVAEFFIDDVTKTSLKKFLNGEKATRLREEEAAVSRLQKSSWSPRLYHYWFNYRKIRRAAKEHLRRNPYPDFESERKALRRDFDNNKEDVAGLEGIVAEWRRAREKIGVPIVMTYVPAGGSLGSPRHQGEFRAFRRITRARGFPFLDVVGLFEKHPAPRSLYLHPRDGHMSAEGHRVMGEALAKLILKGGWLKK